MRCGNILPCLLLLWTLTVSVRCQGDSKKGPEITVKTISDGIEVTCSDNYLIQKAGSVDAATPSIRLPYKDENSGEYECVAPAVPTTSPLQTPAPPPTNLPKIFVKFRTCDNCIELDEGSLAGLAVGNVVATIVIGVAVYLVVSQTRVGQNNSQKKSSDRQHLVPNEFSNRQANDHYQPLNTRGAQRDTYDVLTNRR